MKCIQYSESVLRFHFTDIDDPVYGKATDLRGELPFIQCPQPFLDRLEEIKANEKRVREITGSIISKYRDLWPDLTDEEIEDKIKGEILPSLLTNGLELESEKCSVMTQIFVFLFSFDDFYDSLGPEALESFDDFDYDGFRVSWMSNTELPSPDHLPSGIVEMERFNQCMKTLLDQILHVVPHFKEPYQEVLKEMFLSVIMAHYISVGFQRRGENSQFSEISMLELRRHFCGIPIVLETIAIFRGIRLPSLVRKDDLFLIARNRVADIGIFMNAIFGLFKDVKHQINDSPITAPVSRGEMSLQQAFDSALKQLDSFYNDFMIASNKLVEMYKNEPEVAKYVQLLNVTVDGMLFGYSIVGRYGSENMLTIVKK